MSIEVLKLRVAAKFMARTFQCYGCVLLLGIVLATTGIAHASEIDCGSLENAYGPWDYTNPDHRANRIPIVEGAHFQPEVEALIRSPTVGSVMGALDYTLRAIPNHHRALAAVARYALGGGSQEKFYSADCYFDRAMRFKPDDGMVYMIYGSYLHRKHDYAEAERQYGIAAGLMPDSAEVHYNFGLLFADTGNLKEARTEALQAYKLGYPLRGLRNRLAKSGTWTAADDAAVFHVGDQAKSNP